MACSNGLTIHDDDIPSATIPPTSDRKSTRLNSSHSQISYAVFCLKKNNDSFLLVISGGMTSPGAGCARYDALCPLLPDLHALEHRGDDAASAYMVDAGLEHHTRFA